MLWTSKVHYSVLNSPLFFDVWSTLNPVHSSRSIYLRHILILFFHPWVFLADTCLQVCPPETQTIFSTSYGCHMPRLCHQPSFSQVRQWSSSQCSIHQSPASSSAHRPTALYFSTLLANTGSLCFRQTPWRCRTSNCCDISNLVPEIRFSVKARKHCK